MEAVAMAPAPPTILLQAVLKCMGPFVDNVGRNMLEVAAKWLLQPVEDL
jgi:hypothetical protein